MPRMPGLSNEQSALRSPSGPPPRQWPTPQVLRRWMTKPAFRRAVDEIRHAMEFQSQMHLAAASVGASYALIGQARGCDPSARAATATADAMTGAARAAAPTPRHDMQRSLDLLRLIERRDADAAAARPAPARVRAAHFFC